MSKSSAALLWIQFVLAAVFLIAPPLILVIDGVDEVRKWTPMIIGLAVAVALVMSVRYVIESAPW